MNEYFKEQIAGGASDNFFYGTAIGGVLRIARYRGSIESLVEDGTLDGLIFERMVGSTPFFTKKD